MKEYFFHNGKDQNGPFTVEQLADKGLTNETLVWTVGMENWQKLKNIPELLHVLNPKSVPPPLPSLDEQKIFKTEVSGQLNVTTEKVPNPVLEEIKPSKKVLKWFIAWCAFHLFALVMSYGEVGIFNSGSQDTSEFWPFVRIIHFYEKTDYKPGGREIAWRENRIFVGDLVETKKVTDFNGIFYEYDWTEFLVYVGGALFVFFFSVLFKKNQSETVK